MTAANQTALELLQQLEQQTRQAATSSAITDSNSHIWTGVAFRLGSNRVLASMSEVSEIFNLPPNLTRVPGSLPWVRGIANVRGNLMPIIDLQSYLGGKPVATSRRSRVLVINRGEVITGLLVGDVLGMKRFLLQQRVASARVEGMIGRLVSAAFKNEEGTWPVLSIDRLVAEESFLKAAA